ncbi:thioesterase, partial [Streptomyces durbertensis]
GPVTTPRRHPDLATLVRELDDQLAGEVPGRYAVFGHSMGAMLAFWLVQRRMARGGPLPELFLAAAYAAPHLAGSLLGVRSEDAVDALDDVTLAERLRTAGGLPAELLARPQWLRLLLGTVREDLRLCAAHRYVAAPRLPMPVHVFGGRADPIVSVEQLHGWREHAAADFDCEILEGGHFLVQEPHAGLLPALRRRLTRALTTPTPSALPPVPPS